MKNKIYGIIGILWGGGIIVYRSSEGYVEVEGAFGAGQDLGFILGVIILIVGLMKFFK